MQRGSNSAMHEKRKQICRWEWKVAAMIKLQISRLHSSTRAPFQRNIESPGNLKAKGIRG